MRRTPVPVTALSAALVVALTSGRAQFPWGPGETGTPLPLQQQGHDGLSGPPGNLDPDPDPDPPGTGTADAMRPAEWSTARPSRGPPSPSSPPG
jgi:hypothetical protein